uniref:Uncharacterized protein n=1 Tax=Tanacetum cinerariifolium TaxID=118510 RepID=A0A6L2KDF7_TANCI|nr:hypothetical protein [Tanacetum cinerariifolium]
MPIEETRKKIYLVDSKFYATRNDSKVLKYTLKKIPFDLDGEASELERRVMSKAQASVLHALNYKSTCRGTVFDAPPRLNPSGCAKLTTFVVMCKAYGGDPSHLGRYPTSVRVFPDPILFLAGLKPLWEYGQQRPAIMAGEMAFTNFIYTKDDEDLLFLPKEPSPGFGTEITKNFRESSKPELFVVHPGSVSTRIKDRKCKTRGGLSRPLVKRKLAPGSSNSHATHAKTSSSSKDDVPYLTVADDDEGLLDVLELKDATACHLKIPAITPLAWKNHIDNHIDVELLDLHDRCYARQAVVNNAVNRRSHELLQVIKNLRGEFDVMKDRERAREEECDELQAKCEVKCYRSSYKKDHTQAKNNLATATFPWLGVFVVDPLAPIEALLSKKSASLQRPDPLRTQVPFPSS